MSCTHCDCSDAARSASALAAAMMSTQDLPDRYPMLCGRYSTGQQEEEEEVNRSAHQVGGSRVRMNLHCCAQNEKGSSKYSALYIDRPLGRLLAAATQ